MDYQPRSISFLDRDGRMKHYGIAANGQAAPRAELVDATRRLADELIPGDTYGFTISHDAVTAGLGLVYWWANENELHHRFFASPLDEPGKLDPIDVTGLACVWELEVIDFERRAWLEDVMKRGEVDRYLERSLEDVRL
jgi:hypothetical protein